MIAFFARNGVAANLLLLAIVIAGGSVLFTRQIPLEVFPEFEIRTIQVSVPYRGSNPEEIEESIVMPVSARLINIYPHAHYLGKDLQIYVDHPDGIRQPLLRIPDWDFNWQGDYRFEEPPRIPAQSRVTMHYVYDNSAENPRNPFSPPRRVVRGYNSSDEMAEDHHARVGSPDAAGYAGHVFLPEVHRYRAAGNL